MFVLLLVAAIESLASSALRLAVERVTFRRSSRPTRTSRGALYLPGALTRWSRTSSSIGGAVAPHRAGGADLGCAGPAAARLRGRQGTAHRKGVDASAALLRRAEARLRPTVLAAPGPGTTHLVEGDVRRLGVLLRRLARLRRGSQSRGRPGVMPRWTAGGRPCACWPAWSRCCSAARPAHPGRPWTCAAARAGHAAVRRLAPHHERPRGGPPQPVNASRGARRAARGLLHDRRRRTTRWYDSAVSG